MYPTRRQVNLLNGQLCEASRLYNAALQERRDAWRINRKSINYYAQANQLKEIRANGDLLLANFSACQDVLRRVDRTFKVFFRRTRQGEKPGYPRFKSHARFNSVTYPSYGDGCKLINSKLRLQGIGLVALNLHRSIGGSIRTCTIKREAGRWFVNFVCEVETAPLPFNPNTVGIDVGLTTFATLSDGRTIENPRHYRKSERALRVAQRRVARRKKGSNRRRKAVLILQRIHAHVRAQRADFHHKESQKLVNENGLIAVEDLNVKGLARTRLAKSIHDAGWSAFIFKLTYKAENAGRVLVKVDPRGTSQTCLCGAEVRKTLADRWHLCLNCGLSANRDHVSAQIILGRGLRLQDSTWATAPCVS